MASAYTRLKRTIWSDTEFLALSAPAKLVYLHAISSPKLTMIGSLDYSERRWATATSLKPVELEAAIRELQESRHLLVDWDTDEIIVRTFVRHDVQTANGNVAKSVWRHWEQIESANHRCSILSDLPDDVWKHAPAAALQQRTENELGTGLERTGDDTETDSEPSILNPPSTDHIPPSSTVLETTSEPAASADEVHDRVEAVLEAMCDHKQAITEPERVGPWRAKVIRNDRRDHGARIIELATMFPDAQVDQLAHSVLTGDTANLRYCRRAS